MEEKLMQKLPQEKPDFLDRHELMKEAESLPSLVAELSEPDPGQRAIDLLTCIDNFRNNARAMLLGVGEDGNDI